MSAAFLPPIPYPGLISHQGARADHGRFATYLCGAGGDTWVLEECGEGRRHILWAEEKQSVPQSQHHLEL